MAKLGNWTDEPCWYCTIQDAGKTGFILGPFCTEEDCRKWAYSSPEDGGVSALHSRLMEAAGKADPRSWFYSWGMAKVETGHRDGVLNRAVRPDGIWTGYAIWDLEE